MNIYDIEIKKNKHKFVYIKQGYIRKGIRGDVYIVNYHIGNNNEMVRLTISYRILEKDLWEKDLEKIIDTFRFNVKKR